MIIIYPLIAAVIIAADQITKYLIRTNMSLGERLPVIGDWFRITYIKNTGTAFSMFSGNHFVTIILTSVLLVICIVAIIYEVRNGEKLLPTCFTCIFAGGLSNIIDRFGMGYVTDMISVGNFAIFNVADIFVTCGCILAMIAVLLEFKED